MASKGYELVTNLSDLWRSHFSAEYVERRHAFLAILDLLSCLKSNDRAAVGPLDKELAVDKVALWQECSPLLDSFGQLGISVCSLFGTAKKMNPDNADDGAAFQKTKDDAIKIAQENSVSCVHLFLAILEDPGARVSSFLASQNLDISKLKGLLHNQAAVKQPAMKEAGKSTLEKMGTDLTQFYKNKSNAPAFLWGTTGKRNELVNALYHSNPLLIGEPGVGKTALVHNLACEIARTDVIADLCKKRIVEVNVPALMSDTQHRGELEKKFDNLIKEVRDDPNTFLFFDEVHALVSTTVSEGNKTLADMFKPHLRGDQKGFRLIGATTISEYRRFIEPDGALNRRFTPIYVNEATPETTLEILRNYCQQNGITVDAETLETIVALCARYMPNACFPAKAIMLLDRARATGRALTIHLGTKHVDSGQDNEVSADKVQDAAANLFNVTRNMLQIGPGISSPELAARLRKVIHGQDNAIRSVVDTLSIWFAGLREPNIPRAVLLFVGLSGTGKTLLAKALASSLFGNEDSLIRIDMSEYSESNSVSRLVGSPPGYVGYGDEGQLTGKLRLKPFCVVLIDEIEKAHREVHNLFLQLFDEGRITDSKGRTIMAKDAVFIMTSNIGTEKYSEIGMGFKRKERKPEDYERAIMDKVKEAFSPEFLGRIDKIVLFVPLTTESKKQIVKNALNLVKEQLRKRGIQVEFDTTAVEDLLLADAQNQEYGVRELQHAINRIIKEPLAASLEKEGVSGNEVIAVSVADRKLTVTKKKSG